MKGLPGEGDPRIGARDAGLRRASGLTRWLGVSALGLVGLVAGYVSQANPGHSTGQKAGKGSVPIPKAAPVPQLSTGGGEALAPPAEAPIPAAGATEIASGAS